MIQRDLSRGLLGCEANTSRGHNPEDLYLNLHRQENLKSRLRGVIKHQTMIPVRQDAAYQHRVVYSCMTDLSSHPFYLSIGLDAVTSKLRIWKRGLNSCRYLVFILMN
jgi:hypothetical protein